MVYKIADYEKETELITAMLEYINKELDRCYYNKFQREMKNSPFKNTMGQYKTDVFIVRAYNWESNKQPNFECGDFKVWWYKHCGRGMYVECGEKITYNKLNKIINDCCKSIRKDFGEK